MARDGMTDRPRALDIADVAWEEACRRADIVRPLANRPRPDRAVIAQAARTLGLSIRQVYRLIETFRTNPVTAALVSDVPGPAKGKRCLPLAVEAAIERGIETIYKTREKPRLSSAVPGGPARLPCRRPEAAIAEGGVGARQRPQPQGDGHGSGRCGRRPGSPLPGRRRHPDSGGAPGRADRPHAGGHPACR